MAHTTAGEDRVLVEAPTYRVAAVGTSHGFVEMLPNSKPCDEIVAAPPSMRPLNAAL